MKKGKKERKGKKNTQSKQCENAIPLPCLGVSVKVFESVRGGGSERGCSLVYSAAQIKVHTLSRAITPLFLRRMLIS